MDSAVREEKELVGSDVDRRHVASDLLLERDGMYQCRTQSRHEEDVLVVDLYKDKFYDQVRNCMDGGGADNNIDNQYDSGVPDRKCSRAYERS